MTLNAQQSENIRLQGVDMELKRANQTIFDCQEQHKILQDRIHEMESGLNRKQMELNAKDEAIRQIDIDVREMQCQIEREESANSLLRTENDGLRRDLESMRNAEEMHRQLKNQYDNERQMRINGEGDISRLREQLADQMATSNKELENLRRALDDMKYQNEENLRQINIKNEEIECMMDQMDNLGKLIEKKEWDIADLKSSICALEMKNRKLNETVNKAIYGQTQGNIDKTMEVLTRRGAKMDPALIAKQQSLGINPTSHLRL